MLKTLERHDPETAAAILAAAALATSPNPGTSSAEERTLLPFWDEVTDVLSEVRQRLDLRPEDQSRKARVALDNFLSQQLDEAVFSGQSADEVLARAGQAGRLPPSIYKIVQPRIFRERFNPLGIRKQAVEGAVHRPDDVQHLVNDRAVELARDTHSLFMKLVPATDKEEAYWLLVQTLREGFEQEVQAAWRVYPSDVNLENASDPLDVLKLFVDR